MERYLPHVFVLNIFLTFIDATVGYHAAPTLARLAENEEEGTEPVVRGVRTMLAVVVTLYMFFNCHAFFNAKPNLLLLVTGVVVFDILAQVMLRVRMNRRKEE